MTGRLVLLAFVAGCGAVHGLGMLPPDAIVRSGVLWMALLAGLWLIVLLAIWLFRGSARARKCVRPAACGNPGRIACLWQPRMLAVVLIFALGFVLTCLRAAQRLADALPTAQAGQVFRVQVRVVSLPRLDDGRRSFVAQVLSSQPKGVPQRIQVRWMASKEPGAGSRHFPEIVPGQVWRMALTMKLPWGPRNPHSFDLEAHLFAQGIRATGTVRGTPRLVRDDGWAGLSTSAQRARHYVREALAPHLAGMRYGAVLLALAIGDQASVAATDWQVFNRSGITHLVSISGSHITMVAALGGASVYWLWRRLRWRGLGLAEWYPAQVMGAVTALVVAWLYCLLAGWGVPAQRTFLMLAVVAFAHVMRIRLAPSAVLCLAAAAVVALDPWSLFASGFWLSFGAVAVLLTSSRWTGAGVGYHTLTLAQRVRRFLFAAVKLQCAVSVALMPVLGRLFHDVSLVSPLTNAYAIPVIGLAVTPLALLAAACAVTPGLGVVAGALAWLGHALLQAIMLPTAWLASLPVASVPVAASPVWLTLLAMAGLALALMPYGAPLRRVAWLLLLPALLWRPDRPRPGEWAVHALDVGQAGAIVVQTARHTLLFDTGAQRGPHADDGERIIAPYLRALGVTRLDTLVVSHADADHAGGLRSIMRSMQVSRAYSSFDLASHLREKGDRMARAGQARHKGWLVRVPAMPMPPASSTQKGERLPDEMLACQRGERWEVDGVVFEFLWPIPPMSVKTAGMHSPADVPARDAEPATESPAQHAADSVLENIPANILEHAPGRANARATRNEGSCVLRVSGAHHAALLTGDIGTRQETALVRAGLPPSALVLAPHHGSKTGSGAAFVRATSPVHVIAQSGPWNRHGHPAAEVVARWRQQGAAFWRSDWHGAVVVRSTARGVSAESARLAGRRYWTTRLAQD